MDAAANKMESKSETPEKPEAAGKKPKKPFLILGVIAAVVALGITGYVLLNAGKESTDDAQVEADVVPMAPRVGGQVMHLLVQENQRVKKGDVILQLDDADYAARVDQAQAELETAQAQAEAADAQVKVTQASAKGGYSSAQAAVSSSSVAVANADAQIAAAKADAQKATTDLRRARELRAANAVPQENLDNAQAAYDAATARLTAAEESKRSAISRVAEAQGHAAASAPVDALVAAAQAQANLAHARVKSAQAALNLTKLQLSYTKLTVPEDGVVSKLTAREGQLLSAGQAVAELVPHDVYVVANFKETQVGRMQPGQHAEVAVDAFGGHSLAGEVESLSGGTGARFSLLPPDNASGNFVKVVQRIPVRIKLRNLPKDVELRAGMSTDVTVTVK
jgi:membrane fusion protein (multidrug efflux system)